jgi:hypothetical protein
MRTHIAKALQRRSRAIQRAVKTYNTAASALDPPRPTIDWNTVSHYKFLEEFPLLRNTSQDLTGKRWALPAVRETMKQWRRICRAHEEIIRCNIEVRRLHTSIVDEEESFHKILSQSTALGPIHGAVKDCITRRSRVNAQSLRKIAQIYNLKDFSGSASPGVKQREPNRKFRIHVKVYKFLFYYQGDEMEVATVLGPSSLPLVTAEYDIDDNSDSEDENFTEGMVNMLDFVSDLP